MELAVVSGKGGTGKTTIVAALAQLAQQHVTLVDADVDAPNLYLMVKGDPIHHESFSGEQQAVVNPANCLRCGRCNHVCHFDAIHFGNVDPWLCEGCGACTLVCPTNAIQLQPEETAEIEVIKNDERLLIRAQMKLGGEGSGKLIAQLRKVAKTHAPAETLTIIDGSPGIGCAVISSITGVNHVLIITEPTHSGLADLQRITQLCEHFTIPASVCINQYDLNEVVYEKVQAYCEAHSLPILGEIPFDPAVRQAQRQLEPITKHKDSPASQQIQQMWNQLQAQLH
ncbi:ATP-binding protein [Rubeoparvulum massiliense]|uniref:ATP-binding protein n=1 Tax=Rubeoparvulum massiliense TaxID=1631346 RepID=UPI00065E1582|nr:ATP-binding protein [Rubeoparvulum massiliense]